MMYRSSLLALAVAVACSPTDTGNPVESDPDGVTGEDGFGSCDERAVALDGSPDEVVAELGFSPRQVLSYAVGEHRQSLAWLEPNGLTYAPGPGRSDVVVDVEAIGATRWIQRSPRESDGREEGGLLVTPDIGVVCPDELEIPVRVRLETEDGALAETAESVVRASVAEVARMGLSLEVAQLAGSFDAEVDLDEERYRITRGPSLGISLRLFDGGMAGEMSISTEFESIDGSAVGMGGSGNIAQFPADGYCGLDGVPLEGNQEVRGLSIDDTLTRLNDAFPSVVVGSGATMEASFESEVESTCLDVHPYGGETTLRFPGTVTLASSDGLVDGSFSVELSARSAEQAGADLSLTYFAAAEREADDVAEATTLASSFGIQAPLDFSGYDGGRYELRVEVNDQASSGSLTAYALDVADCVTNPPEPDPNGQGSPGCRGTDRVEIWAIEWSE